MINPIDISFYDAEESKLQEFLLFCLFVAGKNANTTSKVLDKFLGSGTSKPFDKLCSMVYNYQLMPLRQHLENCRAGQYSRLEKALNRIHYNYEAGVNHFNDLKNISFEELISVPGIGRKTAHFFLMYTKRNYEAAVLDTHILKYLKALGCPNVPKSTPQSQKKYSELQEIFISICRKSKVSLSEADLEIWKFYSGAEYDKNKIPQFNKIKGLK
jgi:thermostable 8-oxoguanine DNA glycosylase